MVIYKIFTPNPQFTGERASVTFTAGFGVTSNAGIADELRRMGYHVAEVIDPFTEQPADDVADDIAMVTATNPESGCPADETAAPIAPAPIAPTPAIVPRTLGAQADAKRSRTKRG